MRFKDVKSEKVACDFCHSKSYRVLLKSKDYINSLPGSFQIVKCLKCGLVFTNPRIVESQISHYYPKKTSYYIPQVPKAKKGINKIATYLILDIYFDYSLIIKNKVVKFLLKILCFPFFYYHLRYLSYYGTPRFVKNGRLLDVGCSYGRYMLEMKRLGWNVEGVEFDKNSAAWGRNHSNLDITFSGFDEYSSKHKFDVIVMRMFLEHSYSPKKIIAKAKSLLKSGGQLIITIPDFNGFERQIYKSYSYTLQLPAHLFHFTEKTLKRYLKAQNFNITESVHTLEDKDLIAPISFMERDGKNVRYTKKIFTNFFIRHYVIKLFLFVASAFGKTSRITIYCQKK